LGCSIAPKEAEEFRPGFQPGSLRISRKWAPEKFRGFPLEILCVPQSIDASGRRLYAGRAIPLAYSENGSSISSLGTMLI
jgi:hypothetical protein